MAFLELFDETLDINSTENYELSVQLSYDSLSFCILDGLRNKYILLRSFTPESYKTFTPDQISDIISKDDFITKKYRKVSFLMPSLKHTIIPAPLFDPGRKDEYFSFNHSTSDSNIILTNRISDPDSFLLFAVDKSLHNIIKGLSPAANPFHHLKTLFDQISHFSKSEGEYRVHLHIESDFFNLIIFNSHSLQFNNSFSYRNISDILYYVLNAFKNLGVGQEETVFLSGLTERYDDLYSNLSLYIRNVKFAVPAGTFTFSYVFNDTELHKFVNLLTVTNCE